MRGKSRQTACPKRTPCHHAPIWQPQSRFPVACGRARVGEAPSTLGESREVPSFPLPPRGRGIQGEGVQDTSWAAVPKLRPRNALPPSVVPGWHAADRTRFLKSTHPAPGWRPGRNLPTPALRAGDQRGRAVPFLPLKCQRVDPCLRRPVQREARSSGFGGWQAPDGLRRRHRPAKDGRQRGNDPLVCVAEPGSTPSSPTLLPRRGRRGPSSSPPPALREGDSGGGRRAGGSATGSRPGGHGPPIKRRAMP